MVDTQARARHDVWHSRINRFEDMFGDPQAFSATLVPFGKQILNMIMNYHMFAADIIT